MIKKRIRKLQKLHVCKVYDEEDFRIEDEVNKDEITEDSAKKAEELRLSILWITTLRLLIMLRIYLTLNRHDCLSWESGGRDFDWYSADDDTYFSHLSRGHWF